MRAQKKTFARPRTPGALEQREAIGIIRASRFVRHQAKKMPLSEEMILEIHAQIFSDAYPDVAGKYRRTSVGITGSSHEPPHHKQVPELMYQLGKAIEDRERIKYQIPSPRTRLPEEKIVERVRQAIEFAAFVQHRLTNIHPFGEGNGRTARLLTNYVLIRAGLPTISVEIEHKHKPLYRHALAQADKGDLGPLMGIIGEGVANRQKELEGEAQHSVRQNRS
jgi:Fic family protein